MYEQVSHSVLNDILEKLKPEVNELHLRHFYTRLGSNFYAIHSLFQLLYGGRDDVNEQLVHLVETLLDRYLDRSEDLRKSDLEREKNHTWFLSERWVGMALYCDRFAGDLNGLRQKLPYLQELGINLVHIMPILDVPEGKSDGGYAVRDYRKVATMFGSNDDVESLALALKQRGMLLVLDVVVNHTSDEHQWALKARQGDPRYKDYYYTFPDRVIPNLYEETLPEIFPETSPGNFTWDDVMGKWVMTVFNNYQWDLNYSNPAVLIEMIDVILFWANKGADILRLDAVAFIWKKIGSTCQNEREAHLLLQLMKDCCQITAPGVLFIAEAIVAPSEIAKYFGEDAINAKECEIAYNATLMALLWDAVATKNAALLNQGIRNLPVKLPRATWLNYVRCHDDIGLGFDDKDVQLTGSDPILHRRFLIDYFTGRFQGSIARGLPFGENPKTGDMRISGSLASLVGLEVAIERNDEELIESSIRMILLLHSVIFSFGGLPLLYYGDAIGMLNSMQFLEDPTKRNDSRWTHRSSFNWDKAARRTETGSVENRIFVPLKKLIALRKEIAAFGDFDNRQLIRCDNSNLFVYSRIANGSRVLVVCNFNTESQPLAVRDVSSYGFFQHGSMRDLCSGESIQATNVITVPALSFYWFS